MDDDRFKTLFSLRAAARVMQRQARLWRRADAAGKFISVFAASGAYAALGSVDSPLMLATGLILAAALGFDLAIRPGERAAEASACARLYERPAAAAYRLSDLQLNEALEKAREEDECAEIESLRLLAWNDAAREFGCAASTTRLSFLQKVLLQLT